MDAKGMTEDEKESMRKSYKLPDSSIVRPKRESKSFPGHFLTKDSNGDFCRFCKEGEIEVTNDEDYDMSCRYFSGEGVAIYLTEAKCGCVMHQKCYDDARQKAENVDLRAICPLHKQEIELKTDYTHLSVFIFLGLLLISLTIYLIISYLT